MRMTMRFILWTWLLCLLNIFFVTCDNGKVTSISPNVGSVRGNLPVTIKGEGFSTNQYEGKNEVFFIHRQTGSVLQCSVMDQATTDKQIKCETPRPPTKENQEYHVKVKVNGVWLNNDEPKTFCGGTCNFHYQIKSTPILDNIFPAASLPGEVIRLEGTPFAWQISRLDPDGFDPDDPEIQKMYIGTGICNPFDSEDKKLLGTYRKEDNPSEGWIKCQTTVKTPGFWRASFIASNVGRSAGSKRLEKIDNEGHIYHYQTYANVESISPDCGSIMGGTQLTITGKGFGSADVSKVKVKVAGVECLIDEVTDTVIKCTTGEINPLNLERDSFPGPRGFQQELWTNCNVRHVDENFDERFKPGASNYVSSVRTDKQELSSIYNNYDGRFDSLCAKFNGYFRPPYTGYFKLLINADDTGDFYFSDCESNCTDSDLRRVAYTTSYTHNFWTHVEKQQSEYIYLDREKSYRYVANFADNIGQYMFQLGLFGGKTSHTETELPEIARDEQQEIKVVSNAQPSEQILDLSNFNGGSFKLKMGSRTSTNSLRASSTTKKEELQAMIDDVTGIKCTYSINVDGGYFFQDFEAPDPRNEIGTRTSERPSTCGRKSLRFYKNSWHNLFHLGRSYLRNGTVLGPYRLQDHHYFCFSHRGDAKVSYVQLQVDYGNTENADRRHDNVRISDSSVHNEHKCFNIYDAVTTSWLVTSNRKLDVTKDILIRHLYTRTSSYSTRSYYDNVWIGNEELRITRTTEPDFDWSKTVTVSDDLAISLHAQDCMVNIPRLEIHNWAKSTVGANIDQFTSNGHSIIVNQTKELPGPATGSFDLKFTDRNEKEIFIRDIPVNITSDQLRARLEGALEDSAGTLAVTNLG
uniref:IPT/TIG domain-containing protein n=3 Tax=Clytia hemisphaerica TaxID=252671 RepID=A0A7M5WXN7_9CNID